MVPKQGRRAGAERPTDDRQMRGGQRSGARPEGGGNISARTCEALCGEERREEPTPTDRAERSNTRGGQYTPRRTATKGSGGEGGRGGGGRGQGLCAGGSATTTRQRAQRTLKR